MIDGMADEVIRQKNEAIETAIKSFGSRVATLQRFTHSRPPVIDQTDLVDSLGEVLARIETVSDGYKIRLVRTDFAKAESKTPAP